MSREWKIVVLTEEDIKATARKLGVELTDEEIEKVAYRVKKDVECDDGFWMGLWESLEYNIKEVKEEMNTE